MPRQRSANFYEAHRLSLRLGQQGEKGVPFGRCRHISARVIRHLADRETPEGAPERHATPQVFDFGADRRTLPFQIRDVALDLVDRE